LPLGQEKTRAQKHQSMTLAHRFKRVFNVDSETCEQCGGAVKVTARLQRQIGRKADLHNACCPQG
jgi:rRNA maturation endonuclease Nob1